MRSEAPAALATLTPELARDNVPTYWAAPGEAHGVLQALKPQFEMLYDLTAVDERSRRRPGPSPQPAARRDFTVVYHLFSFRDNQYLRLKVPLADGEHLPTLTDVWPAANWYEREAWDM